MGCRIGISTRPLERIELWCRAKGHARWEAMFESPACEQAQNRGRLEAARRGCRQGGGGWA